MTTTAVNRILAIVRDSLYRYKFGGNQYFFSKRLLMDLFGEDVFCSIFEKCSLASLSLLTQVSKEVRQQLSFYAELYLRQKTNSVDIRTLLRVKLFEQYLPYISCAFPHESEWIPLRISQARLMSLYSERNTRFEQDINSLEDMILTSLRSGQLSKAQEIKHLQIPTSRMCERGWLRRDAEEFMLITTFGLASISNALTVRDSDKFANTINFLFQMSLSMKPSRPIDKTFYTYTVTHGFWGVCTHDDNWNQLIEEKSHKTTFSLSQVTSYDVNINHARRNDGLCIPIRSKGEIDYEFIQSDIICFVHTSRYQCIELDEGVFSIPIFSNITLRNVLTCKQWTLHNTTMQCNCYVIDFNF